MLFILLQRKEAEVEVVHTLLPHITFKFNGQPIEKLSSTDISPNSTVGPEPTLLLDVDENVMDDDDDGEDGLDEPPVPGNSQSLIERTISSANMG